MNSLDDKKKVDDLASESVSDSHDPDVIKTPLDAPLLYNDVVIDASELDQDLDFKVEEIVEGIDNTAEEVPFNANEFNEALKEEAEFAAIPTIRADQKILETRQEPVMSDGKDEVENTEFSATDDAAVLEDAEVEEEPAAALPKKQRKGSVLGMGWFQGFNLFICGVIFVGLAIFSYFIFGEKPLYTGELPKYVVVGNDELGSMGALNPAIPEEERKAYIYVPKVERADDAHILQDKPVLDSDVQDTRITTVELQSGDLSTDEMQVSIETEDAPEPAFTLLSVDHNADGISREDLVVVEALVQQAETAFMQGNYVGIDENDAYYFYQQALELDPKNRQAEQGLASIADIYYRSAYDAFTYGNQDVANQYLMIGLKVAPNHRPLQELQNRMQQQALEPALNNNDGNSFGGFEFN